MSLLWLVNQKMEMWGQRSAIGCSCLLVHVGVCVCVWGGGGAIPSLFGGRDDVQAPVPSIHPFILQLRCQKSIEKICAKPAASDLNHAHPPSTTLLPSCVKRNCFFQQPCILVFPSHSRPAPRPTAMGIWRRMRSGSIFPSARLLRCCGNHATPQTLASSSAPRRALPARNLREIR